MLKDTPFIREKFRMFGAAALSAKECAYELGFSRATIFAFFNRAPAVRDIYHKELHKIYEARREERLAADRLNAARLSVRMPLEMNEDGTCPVCGDKARLKAPPDSMKIDISTAALEEAQAKLEKLIERRVNAKIALNAASRSQ